MPRQNDPNDPHVDPSVDHLSEFASEDAIKAAEANSQAIREVVGFEAPAEDKPPVADVIAAHLADAGVENAKPQLPESAKVKKADEPVWSGADTETATEASS